MARFNPRNRRRWLLSLSIMALLAAIFFAAGARALSSKIVSQERIIFVNGQSVSALADSLVSAGAIVPDNNLKFAAKALRVSRLRDGRYRIDPSMSALQVMRLLKNGNQTPLNLTFNNIRTLPQLAGSVGRQLQADSMQILEVLTDDSTALRLGFTPDNFIGMFIPDTYEVYWTMSPEGFVARMNREYERFWNDERRTKLQRLGLDEHQVAVLASIIDEETVKTDEMRRIAGVYINRLRRGMLLQADPTVKYAVGDFTLRRILNKHLTVDSPYNTYIYKGLPPGPIRMPSKAALDAVLDYEQHDYYYFCARDDFSGYHSFAKTLAEHSRNARKYTAALNRLGIK